MAKLTKETLKSIVKECLVEIFAEGLGGQLTEAIRPRKTQLSEQTRRPTTNHQQTNQRQREREEQPQRQKNGNFEKNISQAVSMITDDDMMRSIFEDTAKTTLQEQIQHDPEMQSAGRLFDNGGSQSGGGIDLDSMFGGLSSNWAEINERLL